MGAQVLVHALNMKTSAAAFLFVLYATCATVAADDAKPAPESDQDFFQGTWHAYFRQDGKMIGSLDLIAYTFEGGRLTRTVVKDAEQVLEDGTVVPSRVGEKWFSTYRIDPDKNPKHLDLTFRHKGKKVVKKCIYRLGNNAIFFVERESDDPAPITRDDKRLITFLIRVPDPEAEKRD
jgi:uncharacterized protein (TIGR03067 family)